MQIKNLFRYWTFQMFSPGTVLREKYEAFKVLLEYDKKAHDFMAELEDIFYNEKKCDFQAVIKTYDCFAASVSGMVEALLKMCPSHYWSLKDYFKKFDFYIRFMLTPPDFDFSPPFTIEFNKISLFEENITGKKAFSLSHLNRELHLPTPDGFVITTNAFHYFLEVNNLQEPINTMLANIDISNVSSCKKISKTIKEMILNADVPDEIVISIDRALKKFEAENYINCRFALRSSAVKEDGPISFAGQYKTVLNVDRKNILTGYKQVIAGKYSPQALFYRISHGVLDYETPMAVLVLEMIDSKTSGVIYTRDFEDTLSGNLLIHSIWGQGELLVDGETACDLITISKKTPDRIAGIKIAAKKKQMVLSQNSQFSEDQIEGEQTRKDQTHRTQTRVIDTKQNKTNTLSLDQSNALTLAKWALSLEKHFKQPQDIEWCQNKSGKLFILQSRPLNIDPDKSHNALEQKRASKIKSHSKIENKIICSNAQSICRGVGFGPVYRLEQLSQIDQIPEGSVLVVKHALPQFVTAINKVNAIIIETGSFASHFASIAREFEIPTIVNPENGFKDLVPENSVTVDAESKIVYDGFAAPLVDQARPRKDLFKESSFMIKLQYVMSFAAKLKLTNPESDSFKPEACRSLHDIIRFTHETAVREMFSIGKRKGGRKKGAKKLILDIPMLFYILDVGSGVKKSKNKILKPENIASLPMNAVLKGLLHPGICWTETSHFDWEEYDKIVMAGGIISADASMFGSYAILSKEYMNVNFRFGYHFVILDTICSPIKEDNYILFRFSGGGGTPEGRTIRADFIKKILIRLGFMVQVKSDLIDAQFKQGSLNTMEKTLDMTGRLLGATKLMDMYLNKNLDIEFLIDEFINGRYDFRQAVGVDLGENYHQSLLER
jgi:pyruvate, water dikinase